jgi:hypothetical protein
MLPEPIRTANNDTSEGRLLRMPLGYLNRSPSSIRSAVRAFRIAVEKAVLALGDHGIATASRIHTACLALQKHLEAERRAHAGRDTLTLEQQTNLATLSMKLKESVDRALRDLGLTAMVRQKTLWEQAQAHWAEEARQAHDDASNAAAASDGGSVISLSAGSTPGGR